MSKTQLTHYEDLVMFALLLRAHQGADIKALLGNSDATFEGYVLYKDELHELLTIVRAEKKALVPLAPAARAPQKLVVVYDTFAPRKLVSGIPLHEPHLDILNMRGNKERLTKIAYAIMYEVELNEYKYSKIINPESVLYWMQYIPYINAALIDLLGVKLFAQFAEPERILDLLRQ